MLSLSSNSTYVASFIDFSTVYYHLYVKNLGKRTELKTKVNLGVLFFSAMKNYPEKIDFVEF